MRLSEKALGRAKAFLLLPAIMLLLLGAVLAPALQPAVAGAAPDAAGDTPVFEYQGNLGWWTSTSYAPASATDRVVAGDFDNDGRDDTAVLYSYGPTSATWHVWLSNGDSFDYLSNLGWWSSAGYAPGKATGRVVAGDYNGDGRDDAAILYDYGPTTATWHVWLSDGDSFEYQSNLGWWTSAGYAPAKATGRVVAGDYNGDGRDDVAILYDYGPTSATWHVWLSDGDSFEYQSNLGWWTSTQYAPASATGRVVAGDFDNDGRDDIAVLYSYGLTSSTWHVWLSTGDSFDYQSNLGWWSSAGYAPASATGRVVAGDFDNDGPADVAVLYDYGETSSTWHVWLSSAGDTVALPFVIR